ncbi:urease accessory protein UreD [Teredinibacter haidensis]|uniref:urease accessory protein UreD n=1 Tax=Teredinibacter haidensis TaxID=2731755 RepID=UPI000948FCBD|nr:urease accessory protein UreD [Teredinibacter haidensis]
MPQTLPFHQNVPSTVSREWRAKIELGLSPRAGRTRLVRSVHKGPLRVQRPFYPEPTDCCHVYLLHPPGGLVIGDQLNIAIDLEENANALITTPSAGKIYGAKGSAVEQCQSVVLRIASGATLEWLPQETIVFDSSNGRLSTRVELEGSAQYAGWDIVRLGRAASGETFKTGECRQNLEIWQDEKPLFIERNRIVAGGDIQQSIFGLQNKNTFGTFLVTASLTRDTIDGLIEQLLVLDSKAAESWGLTQKQQVFIARYLGDDVALCRKGFELIWKSIRPIFNGREATAPRIWNT